MSASDWFSSSIMAKRGIASGETGRKHRSTDAEQGAHTFVYGPYVKPIMTLEPGDTLVVDKTNFNDTSWISAEGRISFHSDALHTVERYRRLDAKTLEIEATLEDPKVLTKPWVVPKQTLQLAPFDQIIQLACSDDDIQSFKDAAPPAISGKN